MTDTSSAAPPPPSHPRWRGFLSPFEHVLYRQTWFASLGIFFGSAIQMTGASWMMTTLTSDPVLISLVQASTTLPLMLFSVVAGAIADNFHRRKVMMLANAVTMLISIGLFALTLLGVMTPWWLLGFTFLVGCGQALNSPSWQASVGDLIPREQLANAMILNSVGFNISRSLGPALGGLLVTLLGVVSTFAVNALSYARMLWVLYRWPNIQERSDLPRERIGRSVYLGLRYVMMSPNIRRILFRAFWYGLAAIPILALLPVVTRELVMGGASSYGILLGAFGIGGLAGALLSNRLRIAMRNESIVKLGFLMSAAGLALLALSSHLWLTAGSLVISGAAWVLTLSLLNVSVQLSSPRWVVGRTLAIYYTAVYGGFSAGSWLWGWAAERFSLYEALMTAAAALVVGAVAGLRYPMPDPMDSSLAPSNHWQEPQLEMKIQPNSGPILIEIEYLIREEDVPKFLEAMEERRRARIRDGAYHWTLLRNLHHPTIWTVTYQFPTWLEYVRHNKRITEDDAMHGNEVLALHQSTEPPRVRRLIERQTIVHPPSPVDS